jgi:glucose/arabinose dehydrogenase
VKARRSPSAVWAVLAVVLAMLLQIPVSASADPALPAGFQDQVVLENLDQPTNFRFAPDGRIFVAEKPGKILVFENLADTTPEVFADLRTDVYDNGDRGLLGLALDPQFEAGRPYVYALYTWDHVLGEAVDGNPKYGKAGISGDPDCPTQNTSHSCLVSGRLVRLTASGNHSVAQKVLVEGWCQQFSSHSVGDLQFGPEGALYVSGGDGAAYESLPDYGQLGAQPNPCGDPPGPKGSALSPPSSRGGALRAQNEELLNGKILRIDPSTGKGLPDNPLAAGSNENEKRLVAMGFRNPFRFTFDQETGEIYTGNVGSSEIEEIDRFAAPPATIYNSGWPCYEGIQRQYQFAPLGLDVCTGLYDAEPGSTSKPFFNYSHGQSVVPNDECPTDSGSAVGGVSFYRGDQFPAEYKGAFFFADAVRGCIWVMLPGADGKPDPTTTRRFLRESKIYPGVKISEGPGGYLYYADLFGDENGGDGAIHRIVYAPGAPSARLEADPPYGLYGPGPSHSLKVSFDASASTDPGTEPLSYEWDMDGDGTFELVGAGAEAIEVATYTEKEQEERETDGLSPNHVVAVRVKDGEGLTSVARITVYPGDKPPLPEITSPLPSFRWAVGDPIELDGSAVDANGDPISVPLPYYWIVRLAHCPDPSHPTACHVHPLQTFAGIRSPELLAPQHDYPSYIEAILRVSDDRGLSGTTSLKIDPRTVDLSIASDPPGIELTAGSAAAPTPFAVPAIVGSEILLSAPPTADLNGSTYAFQSWSDGGERSRPILVASPTQYTAFYAPTSRPEQPPRLLPPQNESPQTLLRGHPPKQTRSRTARFSFGSDTAGAGFRCRLDSGRFAPCRSPRVYRKLKPGRHRVEIAAVAPAGLSDASPIRFAWKISARKHRH